MRAEQTKKRLDSNAPTEPVSSEFPIIPLAIGAAVVIAAVAAVVFIIRKRKNGGDADAQAQNTKKPDDKKD